MVTTKKTTITTITTIIIMTTTSRGIICTWWTHPWQLQKWWAFQRWPISLFLFISLKKSPMSFTKVKRSKSKQRRVVSHHNLRIRIAHRIYNVDHKFMTSSSISCFIFPPLWIKSDNMCQILLWGNYLRTTVQLKRWKCCTTAHNT